jgi:hypothetical protein
VRGIAEYIAPDVARAMYAASTGAVVPAAVVPGARDAGLLGGFGGPQEAKAIAALNLATTGGGGALPVAVRNADVSVPRRAAPGNLV